jgi:hypothetical protein
MIWGALAGAFVGSLVLGLTVDAAVWARLSRFDIPLVLGTAFARRRVPARVLGYGAHLVLGLAFAAVYVLVGVSGWWEGAIAGLVHGGLAVTAIYPVLLPLLHPRMSLQGDKERALVEAPGAVMLAYGWGTPVVMFAAHVAYGALVGGFAGWAA